MTHSYIDSKSDLTSDSRLAPVYLLWFHYSGGLRKLAYHSIHDIATGFNLLIGLLFWGLEPIAVTHTGIVRKSESTSAWYSVHSGFPFWNLNFFLLIRVSGEGGCIILRGDGWWSSSAPWYDACWLRVDLIMRCEGCIYYLLLRVIGFILFLE